MTLTMKKTTKLSTRWGQLFSNFLLSPEEQKTTHEPAGKVVETDTPQALHAFMKQTLRENRSAKPAEGAPTCSILFVSEDNAARTQIASAYARFLGGEQVFVRSVGTTPAYQVDPAVIEVLKERGIPTEDLKPKTFNPHSVNSVDEIIIFGEGTNIGDAAQTWDITKHTDDKTHIHAMCDAVEAHVRELLIKFNIKPTPHDTVIPEFLAA